MPLEPGQSLIHYCLVEKIGQGGMGVVWKARDARLNRDVAIKILPPALSDNVKRLIRFQREARILASLQHPNVASIYGLEESEGAHFLVMELVDGEDLAQRLRRGAMPMEEALDVVHQLAAGLETAHEKGIVHRDLKPANVKLTPDGKVKVLDFGLAKAFAEESMEESDQASRSPTLTAEATRAGVILGTAAYMSPEQARGRPVDRRADIWAFGCVLYEMLAGTRPFMGETVSDTLAELLKSDPDWSLLPKETPVQVTRLIKRCLRKDPKERLRDIGDARLDLAEVMKGSDEPEAASRETPRGLNRWLGAAVGVLVGVFMAVIGLRILTPAPPAPVLRKLTIPIPQLGLGWGTAARVSPDGHRIAYFGDGRLWVRDLRRFEAAQIPGSEGATHPFWSPESGKIGFAKDGKIWTWTLGGGQSSSICRIPAAGGGSNGGAWSRDGKIYFATFRGGLYEVAAAGGEPGLILPPDASEVDFHVPYLLLDGIHLLVTGHRKTGPHPIVVLSLPDRVRRNLEGYEGLLSATPSPTGHLILHVRESRPKILALPFSEPKLEITGDPFLVAAGGEFPSVSSSGLLVYSLDSSSGVRELVWVDREAHTGQPVGRPRLGLDSPAISPDGRKVAVVAYENENADIWIQDLARGTWNRLISGPESEVSPIWSPSGNRIFYLQEERNFFSTLMEVPADGSGAPRIRVEGVEGPPVSASPDGRTLVFMKEKEGRITLWRLDLEAATEPVEISPTISASEEQPALSPDGRWLAFASDELGSEEILVRPFPGGGQRQQVSLNGGLDPFWSRTGDALFYWENEVLMEVPVKGGTAFTPGTARRLFSAAAIGLDPLANSPKAAIDVAPDGRFLIARRSREDPHRGLLLVENWFEEYRKR